MEISHKYAKAKYQDQEKTEITSKLTKIQLKDSEKHKAIFGTACAALGQAVPTKRNLEDKHEVHIPRETFPGALGSLDGHITFLRKFIHSFSSGVRHTEQMHEFLSPKDALMCQHAYY